MSNMYNWNVAELASACNGKIVKNYEKPLAGFSIDNRKIVNGNVFIAIKGENHDGHKFCNTAVASGASAIIVSTLPEKLEEINASVIYVEDTVKALQQIANYYRHSLKNTKFLAVTGSNGKTTTRSMIYHIISKYHKCQMTEGNFNNHIGLPLTILGIEPDCEYAILEMGMNHKGEITELCKIAEPDAVAINGIGPAHIGILGSMENIARAKAEIIESLKSESKIAIYPAYTDFTEIFKEAGKNCKTYSFGFDIENDFTIHKKELSDGINFSIEHCGKECDCKLNLDGEHNILNASAAISLCVALNCCSLNDACSSLADYKPVGARLEKIQRNGIDIYIDCYNANPASMTEAIKTLEKCKSPRIAVLGDMRELGDFSEKYHRQLGEQVAKAGIELLLCVGEETKYTISEAKKYGMNEQNAIKLNSDDETAELLKDNLKKDTTVLFKASRGIHLEKIIQKLWKDVKLDLH